MTTTNNASPIVPQGWNFSASLCSDSRVELCEWVASYSWWRRWLLCRVLNRHDARRAWALGMAAKEYLFEPGGTETGNDLLRRADAIWADIYGYPNAKAEASERSEE